MLRFLLFFMCAATSIFGVERYTLEKMEKSLQEGKMLYVLFYDTKSPSTEKIERLFEEMTPELGGKGVFVEVAVKDATFAAIKKNYPAVFQSNLQLPFVSILSPSGASMGVYPPEQVTKKAMMESFATCSNISPEIQKFIKAVQERKVVFLCLQNRFTKGNDKASAGVDAYLKEPANAEKAVKIVCDPKNPKIEEFLRNFEVNGDIEEATTVMLTQFCVDKFIYVGSTSKDQLASDLARSS